MTTAGHGSYGSSLASVAKSALFTDFYSLTMAQGYWKQGGCGTACRKAVFEMFFRRQPFDGGYAIFAGLGTLLENLADFSFSDDDIEYLRSQGIFEEPFTRYLRDFRFAGSLWAADEGTVVFPQEPLIRIEGNLIECQIVEGMLLNVINFQSLIATKTRRVWLASGKSSVMEFGLRRAQGPDGAVSASRAAYIGGAMGTSNTLAAKAFGIPALGTMAHSWIMSFPGEMEAFNAYAEQYPGRAVFLIDTYDTLKSGIVNAINMGKKLQEQGMNFGVRLDSGDIQYLSTEVRRMLANAGLARATITVSNGLDESIIETLVKSGSPVDVWGVGTQMVTAGGDSAFTGVYKMAACEDRNGQMVPVMKFSDNPEKTTNPGVKQVWRIRDSRGTALVDVLALGGPDGELLETGSRSRFWHPSADYRNFYHVIEGQPQPLLKQYLAGGEPCLPLPSLAEIRAYSAADLEAFDSTCKRLLNPHVYKVSITEKLRSLKLDLIKTHLGDL
ncbi:MAG: nicotinate phosphoribosyltransferase [Treponema sp.]|jgi:nicotinate phosphoribosyltransferase|nr:nicotinate phosphoribosyltransferase [Treponema sp.]